jgi:hypothetical protein
LQATAANHVKVQPREGVMQSQLGPWSTPGVARMFSGTPPVSATQLPAARSTMQPRTSQVPLGAGATAGCSVHPPATQRHAPGGGAESLHVAVMPDSTQRVGLHGSSQPQSASLLQGTTER